MKIAPKINQHRTGDGFCRQMPGPSSEYTPELAETFCNALRSGKRVSYAAELIGVSRKTAYNWKSANPEFAEQWDAAASYANERMEEVVYEMGINGDLSAAMWWLRNWKPAIYNKETLIKLLLAQAQLANGQGIQLDQDGSVVSVPTGDGRPGFSNVPRRVVMLPDNKRNDYPNPDKVAQMEAIVDQARQELASEPVATEPVASEPEIIPPEVVQLNPAPPKEIDHALMDRRAKWRALAGEE